jgi:2-keto-3-deoxy-L-fuconate dehydrogenase
VRLKNKITLVSGGARGIGAAIARAYAGAGATVFIADVDSEEGQRTADEFGGIFVELDVSDAFACHEAAVQVLESHGRLDVLVNNAGIGHVGTALTTTAEDLDRLHAVNVRGALNLSRSFLPSMIAREAGCIINMASIGGIVGIRDRLAYCATKFAVVGLTKAMALDHALQGIRVNCICPGRVETDFVQARLREYSDSEAAYREMASTQAIGRMAFPEEIADAALYLAGDAAAFVTGSALIIDGGWSAGK